MAYSLINRVIAGGTANTVTTDKRESGWYYVWPCGTTVGPCETEAAAIAQAELITATLRG